MSEYSNSRVGYRLRDLRSWLEAQTEGGGVMTEIVSAEIIAPSVALDEYARESDRTYGMGTLQGHRAR